MTAKVKTAKAAKAETLRQVERQRDAAVDLAGRQLRKIEELRRRIAQLEAQLRRRDT